MASGRLGALVRAAHTLVIAPYVSGDMVRTFAGLGIDASWPRQPGTIRAGGAGYLAVRAAPFGTSPPAVVSAALYVHSGALVRDALTNARRAADADTIWHELVELVATFYGRLLGSATREVEVTGDHLREIVSGLSSCARPAFAALADREWPRARWAQIWLGLALVVEHRNSARYNAASGELTGAEYIAVHATRHGLRAAEVMAELGWPADVIGMTLDQLERRALVVDDALTPDSLALLRELDFFAARAQRELAIRLDAEFDAHLSRLEQWGATLQSARELSDAFRGDAVAALRAC